MLSERFVDALNEQIAREFAAAHQYVRIGAHYAAQTFPQLSAFFYEQADEEREHAMKMVSYLLDRDANVHFGAIEEPRADFPDHVAPIGHALSFELDGVWSGWEDSNLRHPPSKGGRLTRLPYTQIYFRTVSVQ